MHPERFGKLYDMLMTLPDVLPFWMDSSHACAVGWYARAYPADGLTVISAGVLRDARGRENAEAISKVFRISPDAAKSLFYGRWGDTPKQVAARVRQFVESRT